MLDGTLVIDAVAHGYNFSPENSRNPAFSEHLGNMLYFGVHQDLQPQGGRYVLPREKFFRGTDPEMIAHAFFEESPTDAVVYHEVPVFGLLKDGGSPLWVGQRMAELYPGRVFWYAAVSPWHPQALEQVDRAAELGARGIKLYPLDFDEGRMVTFKMNDPHLAYPVFERARARGIRNIAIHKAIPLGSVPFEPFRVNDLDQAALDFPDLNFEIVHGGFAYLEETAMLLAVFPNIYINLEGASAFLVRRPEKFAHILGSFLQSYGHERIFWATGCIALHPRPFVEAFWDFQIPPELVERYGYPSLTPEVKRKILGENAARAMGIDMERLRPLCEPRAHYAEPWSRAG